MAAPLFVAVCFLLVAASCACVFHPFPPALNNRKVTRLGKREPLSDTEFFRAFYGTSELPKEAVLHALRLVAEATGIAAGLIRPPDSLHELARVKLWELDESLPRSSGSSLTKNGKLTSFSTTAISGLLTTTSERLWLYGKAALRRKCNTDNDSRKPDAQWSYFC